MSKFEKFFDSVKAFFKKVHDVTVKGYEWIGTDGLLNMETSALLTIVLLIFTSVPWAAAFSFVIVMAKSAYDKSKGHANEAHDIICCVIGITLGVILGMAHALTVIA